MFKILNFLWKWVYTVARLILLTMILGGMASMAIRSFMIGFNFIWGI